MGADFIAYVSRLEAKENYIEASEDKVLSNRVPASFFAVDFFHVPEATPIILKVGYADSHR